MLEDRTEKVNPIFFHTGDVKPIQYHRVANQKDSSTSLAENRTPVSSVTDWYTDHYATRGSI